ncbi:hypothetical protein AAG565_03625 [Fontimonas sp. SYSU GA230001]|uniref:hypothetical protein n=1 Tax=Fontimonas sp. SYSU GA230001 TaxID=3142450 RepID=UPI0032B5A081
MKRFRTLLCIVSAAFVPLAAPAQSAADYWQLSVTELVTGTQSDIVVPATGGSGSLSVRDPVETYRFKLVPGASPTAAELAVSGTGFVQPLVVPLTISSGAYTIASARLSVALSRVSAAELEQRLSQARARVQRAVEAARAAGLPVVDTTAGAQNCPVGPSGVDGGLPLLPATMDGQCCVCCQTGSWWTCACGQIVVAACGSCSAPFDDLKTP